MVKRVPLETANEALDRLEDDMQELVRAVENRSWPYVEPILSGICQRLENARAKLESAAEEDKAPIVVKEATKEVKHATEKGHKPKGRQ